MLRKVIELVLAPFFLLFAWLLLARIVRHFYKFPMPEFMADIIANPWRQKNQPPAETAVRHGIEPGMTLQDIGPVNVVYTIAAAHRVGSEGKLFAIDIEPRMIERIQRRAAAGVDNVDARTTPV